METRVSILLLFHAMKRKHLPRVFLITSLAVIYSLTLAPGLTWANNGADGGDLIAAAATDGIAHPGGYPIYLLLAKIFHMLPVGSLAFRTNLLSMFAAIGAAWVIYETLCKITGWQAGLSAAAIFGVSPLFWSQAVITEAYTLHVFFIAVVLFLHAQDLHPYLKGLVTGLSASNHLTSLLLLPLLYDSQKNKTLRQVAGFLSGLTIYIILPIRAAQNPPVNWGNPVSIENFIWLVTAQAYQDEIVLRELPNLIQTARSTARLLLEQFSILGTLAGFIGMFASQPPARLQRGLLWTCAAFTAFPFFYNTRDSYLYLLPAFLCFAVWIGLGMEHMAARMPRFAAMLFLSGFAIFCFQTVTHWRNVDASKDMRAEQFGANMVQKIPKNAVVFAKGDEAVFTLWYFRYALRQRTDITVIAPELLHHQWYQQNIRQTYPNLRLPNRFMFAEVIIAYNPQKTFCRVEYQSPKQLECGAR